MPVIVEVEFGLPALTDAKSRLGKNLNSDPRKFTEVIALGLDDEFRNKRAEDITSALNANDQIFTVQFVSGSPENARVWPDSPLPANAADLVAYCEYAQVPQSVIEAKSDEIANSVKSAGRMLYDGLSLLSCGDSALKNLAKELGSEQPESATQTACAIWLVSLDLQNDLATYSDLFKERGLKYSGDLGTLTQRKLLDQWEIIKSVNYLPVVELAIPSLRAIPARLSNLTQILTTLSDLTDELNGLHAKHIYNFAGELWQKLVEDREERAAHYTKPEIAELLAGLSATRFAESSADALATLDLMDAACGTGTLVGAGERALRRLYRLAGGADADLHSKRMENHIVAIDINGIAGTLTAKRLTDIDVEQTYTSSKIAVTNHPAGSLSLLDPDQTGVSEVLGYRDVVQTEDDEGNLGLFHVGKEDAGVDWVLMNPPYARPRKGRAQPTKNVPRAKAKRAGYAMSNGQGGLATDFGNLSTIRLKGNGVFAHVLPLSAAYLGTWKDWRSGMETHYDNIIAIANTGDDLHTSMSADTGMNEMLVVATKRDVPLDQRDWRAPKILCVNIYSAPSALSEGYALAKEIAAVPANSEHGRSVNLSYARVASPSEGFPWFGVGNTNIEVGAIVHGLLNGRAYDPASLSAVPLSLPMATLGDLCETGPTHHLLGYPEGGDKIGAFKWTPKEAVRGIHTHKAMWSADSEAKNKMLVDHTHVGEVVDRDEAIRMNESKTQWFFSRATRWTSQKLIIAKTREDMHGGRSWNGLQNLTETTGACVALFYNSIFGALLMRAYGQTPHGARAAAQVGAIPGLPCPDFGARTDAARQARTLARAWFDSLSELELLPFSYCPMDESRRQIDTVAAEMLGLPPNAASENLLAYYRWAFANEPNVHGNQARIVRALESYANMK